MQNCIIKISPILAEIQNTHWGSPKTQTHVSSLAKLSTSLIFSFPLINALYAGSSLAVLSLLISWRIRIHGGLPRRSGLNKEFDLWRSSALLVPADRYIVFCDMAYVSNVFFCVNWLAWVPQCLLFRLMIRIRTWYYFDSWTWLRQKLEMRDMDE